MTVFVIVDVEAVGRSPISGEMTEFGAVALTDLNATHIDRDAVSFHGLLIEAVPDKDNPAIPFIPEGAKRYDLTEVMQSFREWLVDFNDRVVFVSDNPLYDGQWMWCAFDKAGVENPFGHSGRRIGDFAAGLRHQWTKTSDWKRLRVTKHTHHPVDDAMGNAEALLKLVASSRQN